MIAALLVDLLTRNWALVAMVTTIAFLMLFPYLIIMKYVRISLNIMRDTKPPLSRAPLDFEPLEGTTVEFTARDGVPLQGLIVRGARPPAPAGSPPNTARGMVVFCHEFCADLSTAARYCRPLLDAGYDIFAFDFRGHGGSESVPGYSPRQWVSDGEVNDMLGAIDFVDDLLRSENRPRTLGLFGVSRGACAAILAAEQSPMVTAIVADGAFSTDTTIEFFMKRWAYIFAKVRVVYENHHPAFWRFLRWSMMHFARREFRCDFPSVRKSIMRSAPRAMLFIHGEKDSYLPLEQCRKLYALAGQPKHIWVVPGARHNQAVTTAAQEYAERTTLFFDAYLAGDELAEARLSGAATAPGRATAPPHEPRVAA